MDRKKLLVTLLLAGCPNAPATLGARDSGTPTNVVSHDLGNRPPSADNAMWVLPEAFASNVGSTSPIVFTLDIDPSINHDDVEAAIAISLRGAATKVAGSFSWVEKEVGTSAPKTIYVATFKPAAPWQDKADYVITVSPTGSFNPAHALFAENRPDSAGRFHSVFTAGSHLRVEWVMLVSKDAANAVYLRWRMSESTNTQTLRANVTVTAGGTPLAGSIVDPPTDVASQEYTYFFAQPISLKTPLTLLLGNVVAASSQPLDPADFDSATQVNGRFAADLAGLPACVDNGGCWKWIPVVNY